MGHINKNSPFTRQSGSNHKNRFPTNEKELKSFLGAIQSLSKYTEILSTHTDILRKLLKKQNEWKWTDEHTEAFNKSNECISNIPFLAHYTAQNKNLITIDASTQGLGATPGKNKTAEIKNSSELRADSYRTLRRSMR